MKKEEIENKIKELEGRIEKLEWENLEDWEKQQKIERTRLTP
jgi:hypothetical protein